MVLCWGLWPIHIFVVIDHFSRKVMSVTPLEGPNAGWIIEALEDAFQKHDSPKHIISDQAKVFVGDAFAELLDNWNVKPRFGAIGKHGSISVTERVIKFHIGLTQVKSVNTSKLKATFLHFDGVWHLPVLLFNNICRRIDFSNCNHCKYNTFSAVR